VLHSFKLPTALLEYLDLLRGDCSPAPQGCYTYMIMIEIYIAARPYYCWRTHAHYIETIAPHAPLTYLLSKRRRFITSYVQPLFSSTKRTFVIKVATTDEFRNKWKPSRAIDTFLVNKDEWDTKEGRGKSMMKNALHVQRYGKRHLLGWSDVE